MWRPYRLLFRGRVSQGVRNLFLAAWSLQLVWALALVMKQTFLQQSQLQTDELLDLQTEWLLLKRYDQFCFIFFRFFPRGKSPFHVYTTFHSSNCSSGCAQICDDDDDDDDDEEYDDVLRDEGKDGEDLPSVACEGRFQMKID